MSRSRHRFPLFHALASLLIFSLLPVHGFGHAVHSTPDAGEPGAHTDEQSQDVQALLRAFRETGDDRYLERAWSRIEPRLHDATPTVDLLVDAAAIAQARHEFARARDLLHESLAMRGDNDQAWLLLAAVELVRGAPQAAARACSELQRAALVVSLACQARVAAANGDAGQARRRFERVLAVTDTSTLEAETRSWVASVAGDLAVADRDPEAAVDHYRRSLELAERAQVRAALVDVLIDGGEPGRAATVLAAGADALPLEIRRLIVARKLGREADSAAAIRAADHRFRHWIAVEDWLHAREMARFYLDVLPRPALARRLADVNLGLQKEPEDRRLWQRTRPAPADAPAD